MALTPAEIAPPLWVRKSFVPETDAEAVLPSGFWLQASCPTAIDAVCDACDGEDGEPIASALLPSLLLQVKGGFALGGSKEKSPSVLSARMHVKLFYKQGIIFDQGVKRLAIGSYLDVLNEAIPIQGKRFLKRLAVTDCA